jgi:methionyl-tRNA synthetase
MQEFIIQNPWIIILAVLWTLPWKGVALWKAADARQNIWFIIFLVINTLGILEILYIFFFSRKKNIENGNNYPFDLQNKKL